MGKRRYHLIPLVFLSGCSSGDEKIVDLSAVVFCLYVLMVAVKYFAPMVVESSFFTKCANYIQAHLKRVIVPMYIFSLSLLIAGFYFSGIHRIFVFVGLSLAIITHHLSKLVLTEKSEDRGQSIEIVSLGIGMVVVQMMMWYYGPELFSPF